MIEAYKIVMGKYEKNVALVLAKVCNYVTRGNDFRLEKTLSKYDLQNFGFTSRIMSICNSLPNCVVLASGEI